MSLDMIYWFTNRTSLVDKVRLGLPVGIVIGIAIEIAMDADAKKKDLTI